MKKKSLQTTAILLAAMMLSLTGCQNSSGTSSNTSGSTSSSKESAPASSPKNESKATDDMSVKQTINVVLSQHPLVKDVNDNAFTHWIEEELNVDLVINPIMNSEFKDKMDIMMSTGEYPEVCMSGGYNKVDLYGPDEGIMIPLDEYISEENTPNLLAADQEIKGYLDSMRQLDGKIYAIGRYEETFHVFYGKKCWYYAPLVEKTGLPVPTTTDEFYETLKALKALGTDQIPLMGSKGDYGLLFLGNAFLYLSGAELQMWNDNGTVKSAISDNAYREALWYMNKLYKEGLLYNNSFAQTAEQGQAIANSPDKPVVGFVTDLLSRVYWPIQEEGGLYRDTKALTPLKGPEGVQYASTSTAPFATTSDGAFFITTELPEEKRVRALKVMDLLTTEEAYLHTYGIEGEDWVYSEAGKIGLDGVTPAKFNSFTGWAPKIWGDKNASWVNFFPTLQTHKIRMSQEAPENMDIMSSIGSEKLLYDVTKEQYEPYGAIKKTLPKIRFTVDETNEISQQKTDLQKYSDDSTIAFITGSMDINNDAAWQDYLSQLDKMGLKKVLDMTQMGYDRQYKDK